MKPKQMLVIVVIIGLTSNCNWYQPICYKTVVFNNTMISIGASVDSLLNHQPVSRSCSFIREVMNDKDSLICVGADASLEIQEAIYPDMGMISLYANDSHRIIKYLDFYLFFSKERTGITPSLIEIKKSITNYVPYFPILQKLDTSRLDFGTFYLVENVCATYHLDSHDRGGTLQIHVE